MPSRTASAHPPLEGVPTTVVMAAACHRLASSAPVRPTQRVGEGVKVSGCVSCQESPNFRHGELDDHGTLTDRSPFSAARAFIAERKVWASMAKVMCRYQPT